MKKTDKKKKLEKRKKKIKDKKKNISKEKVIFFVVFLVFFLVSYIFFSKIISSKNVQDNYYLDFFVFEKIETETGNAYRIEFKDYKGENFEYLLANSPYELAKVKKSGEISLNKNVYIFPETSLENCPYFYPQSVYFSISLFQIGFFPEIRRLEKENLSEYYAKEESTIVKIKRANFFQSAEIKKTDEITYEILVKNCDLGLVLEKLFLEAWISENNL